MNLRQYTGARPLLQMAAQGRTADLISGRFQTAPRRALSEKLTQGGQHPNRRRSGMAATLLRRGRAEIDNCRDEVQKPKIQHLLPCLTPQTWSFQTDNAPHQGCITAIPSNPSARDPTTHGISGNCLLSSRQIPQAQLVAQPPEEENDVGRDLNPVEHRAGPLVVSLPAISTAIAPEAMHRSPFPLGSRRRLA